MKRWLPWLLVLVVVTGLSSVAAALDTEGIAVRAGHHCAQPLARRLGVAGTARASFSVYTTPQDIEALAAGLRRAHDALGLRPSVH